MTKTNTKPVITSAALGRKPLPVNQRKVSVNVALTHDTIRQANKYARAEKRRFAEMLRLLIEEALERREEVAADKLQTSL